MPTSPLNKKNAKRRITHNLRQLGAKLGKDYPAGKMYELFVLSTILTRLRGRGCHIQTVNGPTLAFKTAGGPINRNFAYFRAVFPSGAVYEIFTDVFCRTLGSIQQPLPDRSQYHEVDILIVEDGINGYPHPDEIVVAVEAKAYSKFQKTSVREVLGLRRETAFLHPHPSRLEEGFRQTTDSRAHNGSECWFFYIDPVGSNYSQSPAHFGIKFELLVP